MSVVADQDAGFRRRRGDRLPRGLGGTNSACGVACGQLWAPSCGPQRAAAVVRGRAGQHHPPLRAPGSRHRGRSAGGGDQQPQERNPNHLTSTTLAQRHRHRAPTIARLGLSSGVPSRRAPNAPDRLTKGNDQRTASRSVEDLRRFARLAAPGSRDLRSSSPGVRSGAGAVDVRIERARARTGVRPGVAAAVCARPGRETPLERWPSLASSDALATCRAGVGVRLRPDHVTGMLRWRLGRESPGGGLAGGPRASRRGGAAC